MSTQSNFNAKSFTKDLKSIQRTASNVANQITQHTVDTYKSFQTSFDETEILPYASPEMGKIVFSVKDSNPAALDEFVATISTEAAEALKQDFITGMKGAKK